MSQPLLTFFLMKNQIFFLAETKNCFLFSKLKKSRNWIKIIFPFELDFIFIFAIACNYDLGHVCSRQKHSTLRQWSFHIECTRFKNTGELALDHSGVQLLPYSEHPWFDPFLTVKNNKRDRIEQTRPRLVLGLWPDLNQKCTPEAN